MEERNILISIEVPLLKNFSDISGWPSLYLLLFSLENSEKPETVIKIHPRTSVVRDNSVQSSL